MPHSPKGACDDVTSLDDTEMCARGDVRHVASVPRESEVRTQDSHKQVVIKLDTGAQCKVLPNWNVQAIGLHVLPLTVRRIATYSNHKIHMIGEVRQTCTVRGQPTKLKFLIVDSDVSPVLSQNAC